MGLNLVGKTLQVPSPVVLEDILMLGKKASVGVVLPPELDFETETWAGNSHPLFLKSFLKIPKWTNNI